MARPVTPHTADGRWPIAELAVRLVYFVPRDRTPLADWRDRLDYYAQRITAFHHRELAGRSQLRAAIREPHRSALATADLRAGDATFTFLQILGEVDRAIDFDRATASDAFPILLVLSDLNWRALDDFYRVRHGAFDGLIVRGQHVPGSAAGGSRATYIPDRGVGWALVSGDGWRVPCAGSDCVVYHEGVGHAIGLGHPQPTDGSVMGQGQYGGWLHQTQIASAQRELLGVEDPAPTHDLFSTLTAAVDPPIPAPGELVRLHVTAPDDAAVHVHYATTIDGPWHDAHDTTLGPFPAPTPVSYRIRATTPDGQHAELRGYFQVRATPDTPPLPTGPEEPDPPDPVDLLAQLANPAPLPAAYTLLAIITPTATDPVYLELPTATVPLHGDPGRPLAITLTTTPDGITATCDGATTHHPATPSTSTAPTLRGPATLNALALLAR